MAQISATASNGHHTFTLDVNETSVSGSADNYSDVSFALKLLPNAYDWYNWENAPVAYTITIDGKQYNGEIWSYYANTVLTIESGTQRVYHNDNGTKTLSFSFEIRTRYTAYYLPGYAYASGSMDLTSISRAPSLLNTLVSRTETSLTVKWSADMTCDKVYWSSNGGASYTEISLSSATNSGTYTITGLNADTSYNIVTKARGKTSQISGISTASSFKTYSYPYANSNPNFIIGENVKIGIFNPLSHNVTVELIAADDTSCGTLTTSGTSVEGFADADSILYASIPSSASGIYKVKVTYLTNVKTVTGGRYSADASLVGPLIGSISYLDQRARVTMITEDDQLIVQNESMVKVTASNITARAGANLTSAIVKVEGIAHNMTITDDSAQAGGITISSAANVDATVVVTDSRGFTASKAVTLTVLPYSPPSAIYSVARKNNYYSETDIKVNSSISDISGNNHAQLYLSYKKTTDTAYSAETSITSSYVVLLDNNYAWNVKIRVADYFESTEYEAFVAVGIPAIFFDRVKQSIGVGCFPKHEKTVECDGVDLRKSIITLSLSTDDSSPVSGAYTQRSFDVSNEFGGLLSRSGSGIEIGNDITKVLISGRLTVQASSTAGRRDVRICKNAYSVGNTVGFASETCQAGDYKQLTINPVLIDVTPGDILYLYYNVESGDTIIGSSNGPRTCMTVEYVG